MLLLPPIAADQAARDPYRCAVCGQAPIAYETEVLESTVEPGGWETVTAAAYTLMPCGHVVIWRRGSR